MGGNVDASWTCGCGSLNADGEQLVEDVKKEKLWKIKHRERIYLKS